MTRRITLMNSVDGQRRQAELPEPGDIVGGKYRVERTLGIGGMGAVFEVTHCVTHKRFAIKWLLASEHDSQQNIRRFVREAQTAGRIDHTNVVQVYDIYQEESGFFLVMELLAGESLAQRLASAGRFSVREACRIMVASMEGVIAAHAAGVVQRDLKPANIFLCTARPGELEQRATRFRFTSRCRTCRASWVRSSRARCTSSATRGSRRSSSSRPRWSRSSTVKSERSARCASWLHRGSAGSS